MNVIYEYNFLLLFQGAKKDLKDTWRIFMKDLLECFLTPNLGYRFTQRGDRVPYIHKVSLMVHF